MDNHLKESYQDILPQFGNNGLVGYTTVTDLDAIKNSLRNLFLIRKGEVPGKPWLGNPVTVFLFDNIGFFEEQSIKASFINTIENFEPRVRVTNLSVDIESEYNSISVYMEYYALYGTKQKAENLRFTMTYNDLSSINTRIIQGV